MTLCIVGLFGLANKHLNRHLPSNVRQKLKLKLNVIR
jgi:polar amino acid transport system permease protein